MEVKANPIKTEFTLNITLEESEARALSAIMCYGANSFLEYLYKYMGRTYLEPYEKGAKSLFSTRHILDSELTKIDHAKQALKKLEIK